MKNSFTYLSFSSICPIHSSRAYVLFFLNILIILDTFYADIKITFFKRTSPSHYSLCLVKVCNARVTTIRIDVNTITHPIILCSISKFLDFMFMTIHFDWIRYRNLFPLFLTRWIKFLCSFNSRLWFGFFLLFAIHCTP